MNRIEDFINQLDTSGIKPPDPTPADVLARLRDENKIRRHLVTIKPEVYGFAGAAFVGRFNGEQVLAVFIEEYRVKYGDQWVDDALDTAQRSGASIHDCIVAKANGEALALALEASSIAVKDLLAAFRLAGEQIARGLSEALDQPPANNRHDRRSAKHSKRVQEGDQQWQRRYRRKYRP